MKNQFRTMNQIMGDFERQNCQELPAVKTDGIIRDENGRPIAYIDEDGRRMQRRDTMSFKEFFEAL